MPIYVKKVQYKISNRDKEIITKKKKKNQYQEKK